MTKDELILTIHQGVGEIWVDPGPGQRTQSADFYRGMESVARDLRALLADYDDQEVERGIAKYERARMRETRIRRVRPMVVGARAVIPLAARGVVGMTRK